MREISIPLPPVSAVRPDAKALSETEARVKRHLVYTYLMEDCLRQTPEGYFRSPSEIQLIVLMGEVAKTFDYDLRRVPGFYYSTTLEFWKLNVRPGQLLEPYYDGRGKVRGMFVRDGPADTTLGLLTSRGLPLGTPAILPLEFVKGE